LIIALFALVGLFFGSFLNVCILRIPEGKDIVRLPSSCPLCGKRLRWHELIPVVSYAAQRGKCKGCKGKVSAQYPLIELTNAALWVLAYLASGLDAHTGLLCLLGSALLAVAMIDARTGEIPPGINIAIAALGAASLALDYPNWPEYVIGAGAVSLPLLAVWFATKGRGIGGGDIKLMAACGLALGWRLLLLGFFAGCVLGTVIHIARMVFGRAGRSLAFGPYLAAGVFASALWGRALMSWYLSLF
jgi:leader peptidase (prepilin peptidase)/N-methyltransferase